MISATNLWVPFAALLAPSYLLVTTLLTTLLTALLVAEQKSTIGRESYFIDFADQIRPTLRKAVLCVTGGFRTAKGMAEAVEGRSCQSESRECLRSTPLFTFRALTTALYGHNLASRRSWSPTLRRTISLPRDTERQNASREGKQGTQLASNGFSYHPDSGNGRRKAYP
jgi:hypothetical protein